MNKKIVFALSAAVAGMLVYSSESQAWVERSHFSICDANNSTLFQNGGNNSTVNSLGVECPIGDRTTQPRTSITTLVTRVHDLHTTQNILAFRCIIFETTLGGTCGASAQSFNTGIQPLALPTMAAWAAGGNFGSAFLFLPPKDAGNMSLLKGLTIFGTP